MGKHTLNSQRGPVVKTNTGNGKESTYQVKSHKKK